MRRVRARFFCYAAQHPRTSITNIFVSLPVMKRFIALLVLVATPIIGWAQESGFNLIVVGDPQPQTEAQAISLEQDIIPHIGTIVDEYKASGYPTAILLTGDVVWDTMEFLPRIKHDFETLGVPVYAVIGNHDHDRAIDGNEPLAESHYITTFGERYYTFTMGDTRLYALDNIDYTNYNNYSIGVSREQLRWLRREIRHLADNQRIAILMHAPAVDYRTGDLLPYAKRLTRLAKGHELHFVTGHRHRHATADIAEDVVEHSVAQVNGNLWFAPMCSDGTPRGVFCIEERNGEWRWQHRLLGEPADKALIVWQEGKVKNYESDIIVKVIGWDAKWRVEWIENGEIRGVMEHLEICDPGYMHYVENKAQYEDIIMQRLRRSAHPNKGYFRCRRTESNSNITIIATDRFGRQYRWESSAN